MKRALPSLRAALCLWGAPVGAAGPAEMDGGSRASAQSLSWNIWCKASPTFCSV